ncbi:hypothetical protein CEXT_504781 [Caerostris extrusa]|uniref:Uncharacterized protein n=1 Tax=Caerostris extrusa TaxID=172846 RepID=A0AAV4TY05_CAEEX|nr:hypothetical protein CEXT_504781 [Caerostris extrusa]
MSNVSVLHPYSIPLISLMKRQPNINFSKIKQFFFYSFVNRETNVISDYLPHGKLFLRSLPKRFNKKLAKTPSDKFPEKISLAAKSKQRAFEERRRNKIGIISAAKSRPTSTRLITSVAIRTTRHKIT